MHTVGVWGFNCKEASVVGQRKLKFSKGWNDVDDNDDEEGIRVK